MEDGLNLTKPCEIVSVESQSLRNRSSDDYLFVRLMYYCCFYLELGDISTYDIMDRKWLKIGRKGVLGMK